MGWFSGDSSSSSSPTTEDGGYHAPDRSARQLCWDGRDAFFQCLDQHNIIDSVKQDEKARRLCPKELKQFENACATSWVEYFKKRRVMEYQRDQTLKRLDSEGAKTMGGALGGSPTAR